MGSRGSFKQTLIHLFKAKEYISITHCRRCAGHRTYDYIHYNKRVK